MKLHSDYWDKSRPVPPKILLSMRDSQDISIEQYNRAIYINQGLYNREGVEQSLRNNMGEAFTSLPADKRERLILQHMGTDEQKHKEAFNELYGMAIEGTLTDIRVDTAFADGLITTDDKQRLKEYSTKFDQNQKEKINYMLRQIRRAVNDMGIQQNSPYYENLAESRFYEDTRLLDPHSKNFDKELEDSYRRIINTVGIELSKSVPFTTWFGMSETPQGKRFRRVAENIPSVPQYQQNINYSPLDNHQQIISISPNGLDNTANVQLPVPMSDDVPLQSSTNTPEPSNIFVGSDFLVHEIPHNESPVLSVPDMPNLRAPQNTSDNRPPYMPLSSAAPNLTPVQGMVDLTTSLLQGVEYKITDGYYAESKAYRNGRSHFAIDLRAPVGTPVQIPASGTPWTVDSTGYSSAAGNFIKISTTTNNGDNLQLMFGHLSSVDVQKKSVLTPGTVIAKSGNTGNTTGPHLHVSARINGKVIDPRKIDFGNSDGSASTQQTTFEEPVVTSEQEQLQQLRSIIFSGLKSGDLLSSGDFGLSHSRR